MVRRATAVALHRAGVSVHNGTVLVERLWANFGAYFPDAATGVSRLWWGVLKHLDCMRYYYYRRVNHSDVPSAAHGMPR